MPKIFESVGINRPKHSAFDLSHDVKMSGTIGNLYPILCEEILPNDEYSIRTEVMIRFAPLIAPVMHRFNVYVHYFFVPNRIIWSSWENFITGGQDGDSAPSMPVVSMSASLFGEGKLPDYLGFPTVAASPTPTYTPAVSALPFRAYQQIYNDYYRDPNVTDPIDITGAGAVICQIRERAYEKDYFTSALPWTQRGEATEAPISWVASGNPDVIRDATTGAVLTGAAATETKNVSGQLVDSTSGTPGVGSQASVDNTNQLQLLINDLRNANAIQRFLENNARGGARYIEQLLFRWGVKSDDARLQRAEYLGGGRMPVAVSEVLNTSATATQAQGTMAGHAIGVGAEPKMKKRFKEHGWLLSILSVIPRTAYQQGIPKKFLRTDKLDYYNPEFAHLGEQPIEVRELYYDQVASPSTDQTEAFGYQQRFAEYKYAQSTVHGDFRSSLDFWHSGRIFASEPALNDVFMRCQASSHVRMFAVETGDHLWCQLYHNIKARRPMPFFAKPSIR